MKAWPDIESLAKDVEISTRTGWRWLRQGRIKKRKSEGGRIVFVLTDNSTDTTDIDMSATDVSDMSDMSVNYEDDSKERRHFREVPIPSNKAIPVQNPSPELKGIRESIEVKELLIRGANADKKLSMLVHGESPLVKEKRDQLEAKKIEMEFERLTKEETEQSRIIERRKRIEWVKDNILPQPLRSILPPEVLFSSLQVIEKSFEGINPLALNDSEVIAYGGLVVKRFWAQDGINQAVRSALVRLTFMGIDCLLDEALKKYQQSGFGFRSKEDLLAHLITHDPQTWTQISIRCAEFLKACGNRF